MEGAGWFPVARERVAILFGRRVTEVSDSSRSFERYRRIGLSGISSMGAKAASMLVTLITVPIIIRFLGVEGYGVWVTVTSAAALLTFADGGIDDALTNLVAAASVKEDRAALRALVSTSFVIIVGIAFTLTLIFAVLYPNVDWAAIFNVRGNLESKVDEAVLAAAGLFLLGLPLGIVPRVRAGYQEGFITSAWFAFGALLSLIGVVVAVTVAAPLPIFIFLVGVGPLIALLADGVFLTRRRWLRPTLRAVSASIGYQLASHGRYFFVLQFAVAVAYTSDTVIIARVLGPQAVTTYAVPLKIFGLVSIPLLTILTPLWPAYSEALARGDLNWIRQTLRISLVGVFAVGVPAIIAVVSAGEFLVRAWVGEAVKPSMFLLAGMGIWTLLLVAGHALSMFLNGVGRLRIQAWLALPMVIMNVVLSVFLTEEIGVAGPVYGSVISYLLCVLVPLTLTTPRLLTSWE